MDAQQLMHQSQSTVKNKGEGVERRWRNIPGYGELGGEDDACRASGPQQEQVSYEGGGSSFLYRHQGTPIIAEKQLGGGYFQNCANLGFGPPPAFFSLPCGLGPKFHAFFIIFDLFFTKLLQF